MKQPAPARGRIRPPLGGLALVAVLALPLLLGTRYDSFPLSTYPMFAGERDRVTSIATVVAVDGDTTARLSSRLIGGTDEPMLAAETVVHAIRDGAADRLCREVAARAGADHTGRILEVVTERYDTVAWFDGVRKPVARTVHARCEVPA